MKRVLKDDATVWWNIGDIYNTRSPIRSSSSEMVDAIHGEEDVKWSNKEGRRYSAGHEYLKDKDLTILPHKIAEAACRIGYFVRNIIIWQKENVIPKNATDRALDDYETILLLSKSKSYKFDEKEWRDSKSIGSRSPAESENLRTVWKFGTSDGKNNHTATFPEEIPARCIILSTYQDDVVYDPFLGSGTTAVVADQLNRSWIGSEISEEYIKLARSRVIN